MCFVICDVFYSRVIAAMTYGAFSLLFSTNYNCIWNISILKLVNSMNQKSKHK